jgi:Skp family chaperone for outer membrane proteins
LNAEGQGLAAEERGMKDKIKKLEDQRGNFRPNSPQYDEIQKQYIKAVAEWKVWGETFMAERDWRMKALTKMLFDKVTTSINDYASREGIDVVISDFQPQATEKALAAMNVDQLREFLNQRRVLYASKQADVSDQIIALLDTKYRQEGGGAAGAVGAASGAGTGAAIPSIGAAGTPTQPAPGAGNARPATDGGAAGQRRPGNR